MNRGNPRASPAQVRQAPRGRRRQGHSVPHYLETRRRDTQTAARVWHLLRPGRRAGRTPLPPERGNDATRPNPEASSIFDSPPACSSQWFHVLLTLSPKFCFNFPSRYLSTIGLVVIFSLRSSLRPALGCTLKQPDSKEGSVPQEPGQVDMIRILKWWNRTILSNCSGAQDRQILYQTTESSQLPRYICYLWSTSTQSHHQNHLLTSDCRLRASSQT